MASQGSEVSQTRRLTKGKRVRVEVWFWVAWWIPPESNLRRKMVDVLRGEEYMETLSLDKRSQPKSGSGH